MKRRKVSKELTKLTHIINEGEREIVQTSPKFRSRAPEKTKFFWEEEKPTEKAKLCEQQSEAKRESFDEVKQRRAYDECLGIRSRRRT